MSQKQNQRNKGKNNKNDELIIVKYRPRPKIGKCYQAEIPECRPLPEATPVKGSSINDHESLIWDCNILPEDDVKAYEHKDRGDDVFCSSQDRAIRDNENALAVLNNVGYDIEKAEKVREKVKEETKYCWSDEEKKLFEAGFLEFEKNFKAIQEKYFKNKTVQDVVKYYYNWKNSRFSCSFRVKHEKKAAHLRCSSEKMYFNDEYLFY